MISLRVDSKQLSNEINSKITALENIVSSTVLDEIAKAAFVITGERFLIDIDAYARKNPKKMHHVYEWGMVGKATGRLFELKLNSTVGGVAVISSVFLQSKKPVPANPATSIAGVSRPMLMKQNVFKNKATVMENGQSVSYKAASVLSFMGSDGQVFVAPGTIINIKNPGGVQTKHAFKDFMDAWYAQRPEAIMDSSGFYEKIANEITSALNVEGAGVSEINLKIREAVAQTVGNRSILK